MLKKIVISSAFALLLAPDPVFADGAKLYRPCAACHLANGQGVPASFPPLNKGMDRLAATGEGRRYLIAVMKYGVAGTLKTENGTFRGFMPAQSSGREPEKIADVLNYILSDFYSGQTAEKFTAQEVEQSLNELGKLKLQDVAKLRP